MDALMAVKWRRLVGSWLSEVAVKPARLRGDMPAAVDELGCGGWLLVPRQAMVARFTT
jgi:hypothetical protein